MSFVKKSKFSLHIMENMIRLCVYFNIRQLNPPFERWGEGVTLRGGEAARGQWSDSNIKQETSIFEVRTYNR